MDIISPTFAPVRQTPLPSPPGYPDPGLAGSLNEGVSIRMLRLDLSGTVGTYRQRFSVSKPTLLRLISLTLDSGTDVASFFVQWHKYGELESGLDFLAFIPFFGPFAYFAEPGEYEVLVGAFTASTAKLLAMAVITGLDQRTLDMMLDPDRIGYWDGTEITIGAGGTETLLDGFGGEYFPLAKTLRVTNTGANTAVVHLNGSALDITLIAGDTLELGPNQLGRATLTITSVGGTTVESMYTFW